MKHNSYSGGTSYGPTAQLLAGQNQLININ